VAGCEVRLGLAHPLSICIIVFALFQFFFIVLKRSLLPRCCESNVFRKMRPSRRSSEAPEVVPGQLDIIIDRFKRTGQSQYQKQVDERETETKSFPPTPRLPYESVPSLTPSPSPLLYHEEPRARGRSRRALPLVTAIVLVVLAFLLGGGIGGGIGGALAVERTR
jgi:hypothetical protein